MVIVFLDEAQVYSKTVLENEVKFISDKLNEGSRITTILQKRKLQINKKINLSSHKL